MLRLAYANLFHNKVRLVISVGGVALALVLILALDAIFTGTERQLTAYIDNAGAQVFVSQDGVRNLHMASSWLPVSTVAEVRALPDVELATPILYVTNMIVVGEDRHLAYVIGLPPDAVVGKPWRVGAGVAVPQAGQIVLERTIAEKSGVGVGDVVQLFGQEFIVAGLADGTANLVNSVAFISIDDFWRLRGNSQAISFVLVKVRPGASPETVAAQIETEIDGVTAQTQEGFAQQERQVVRDMSTDVITIMNLVGFLIGLAVLALTVYTATLSRRSEYGMLKALGAHNMRLYRTVLAQALLSVALGFGLGLAFTLLLSASISRLGLNLALQVSGTSLLKVAGVSLVIAGLAAILPIKQIAGLDPAVVFRGK
jgi:putative ABC transport system permease protein